MQCRPVRPEEGKIFQKRVRCVEDVMEAIAVSATHTGAFGRQRGMPFARTLCALMLSRAESRWDVLHRAAAMQPRCGAGRRVAPAHRSDAHERPVVALAHDRELHHRAAPRVRLQRGLPESGARARTRPPAPPGESCTRHGSGAALTVGTFRQAEASGATERPPAAAGASAARGANRTRGQRAAAREEPRGQQARRRWECVGEADDRAPVGGGSRRS